MLLKTFQAARKADPYSPTAPTLIARRFDENRQIPEERVRRCSRRCSPRRSCRRSRRSSRARLGRPLEPFDVWYNGFRPRGAVHRRAARRDRPQEVPDGRGLQGGHPESARQARLLRRSAPTTSRPTSSSIRRAARATPLGAAAARRQGAPAHARREGRDELQGLQHRRPRDGPQRRADVLAQRRRLDAARRACRTPPSPRRSPSSSRRTTSSCSASPSPTRRAQALKALERLLGDLRDRRRRARRHGRLALDVRPPQRDARAAEGRDAPDLQGHLEQVLRAGLREEGRRADARHLLAHDRLLPVPARLSDRPPDRVPDRAAGREGRQPRPGVRAHGEGRQRRAGHLDEAGHRRARRRGGAARRRRRRRWRRRRSNSGGDHGQRSGRHRRAARRHETDAATREPAGASSLRRRWTSRPCRTRARSGATTRTTIIVARFDRTHAHAADEPARGRRPATATPRPSTACSSPTASAARPPGRSRAARRSRRSWTSSSRRPTGSCASTSPLAKEVLQRMERRFQKVRDVLVERAKTDPTLRRHGHDDDRSPASLGPELLIAHVGDSRAYVFRRRRAAPPDARPDDGPVAGRRRRDHAGRGRDAPLAPRPDERARDARRLRAGPAAALAAARTAISCCSAPTA